MWSTNKRDRCMRLLLLVINCTACIGIVYAYIMHANNEENQTGIFSEKLIQPEKLTDGQCTEVCDSRTCIWHANMFLRNINENVEPCDDFHSFICSGFLAELAADETANVLMKTKNLLLNKIKGILDNIEAEPKSASAKMKTVYDSCTDYSSSELQGIEDLKNLFNDIGIFSWPVLPEDFSFNGVKLSEILGNFIVLAGRDYVVLTNKEGNETQGSYVQVSFYKRTYNETTNLNRELAVSMLKYFDLEEKYIGVIIEDYDLIRNAILELSEEHGICNNRTCPEVHIDCIRHIDSDWHELCETLGFLLNFNDTTHWYPVVIEKPEDMIFKELFPLLRSFPNRTLANFIALSLIRNFQPELNFYYRLSKLKQKDFSHEFFIKNYQLDRWKFCVQWIAGNMLLPLQNEFLHQYLTNATTEELTNIYEEVKSELIDLIELQEWINTTLKQTLIEELESNTFNIDFIRRILPNDTYANKVYEKFTPTRKSFFDNVLRLKKYQPIIQAFPRKIPKEENVLKMARFDVQAFAGRSSIDFHFGMLFPPLYIPGHINLINRVLLTPIFAHEFGHFIFDTLAMKFFEAEQSGEYRGTDFLRIFREKSQCIEDQFSIFKFQYLNENLNGTKYVHESGPDNVATSMIDKVIEKHSPSQDITLPGLPYSPKQLLYMSSVQMWCEKSNLKKDLHYKNDDFHAPPEYRLLGMIQNSRSHNEAFNCPKGSFMNPENKCTLLDAKI